MQVRITPTEYGDEVRALLATITDADGIPPISDGLLDAARANAAGSLAKPDAEPRALTLGAYDGDRLVGWAVAAQQGTRGAAELALIPDVRGRGWGGELVAAVRETLSGHPGPGLGLAGAAVADGGTAGPLTAAAASPARDVSPEDLPDLRQTWFWSHGDHPAAAHLAQRLGYGRERELLQLHTDDLAGRELPALTVPDGVSLRAFQPGDEPGWLRVNNAAFDWHPEQGGQTPEDYQAIVADPDFDPADVIFAVATTGEHKGRIIGFHETKLHPEHPSGKLTGEVYVIGVDPEVHARGVGRALTVAGMHHMADQGAQQIELYVEADNLPALRLYESLGFSHRIVHASYAPPAHGGTSAAQQAL